MKVHNNSKLYSDALSLTVDSLYSNKSIYVDISANDIKSTIKLVRLLGELIDETLYVDENATDKSNIDFNGIRDIIPSLVTHGYLKYKVNI